MNREEMVSTLGGNQTSEYFLLSNSTSLVSVGVDLSMEYTWGCEIYQIYDYKQGTNMISPVGVQANMWKYVSTSTWCSYEEAAFKPHSCLLNGSVLI